VTSWPCENHPKPKPARSQSLVWSVTVPLDCQVFSSPGLLAASTTNGRASAGGNVLIYAGAPGFVLPYQQARGLFGPFAMQSDPVNSLTGALATVSTDAAAPGLGVPLTATRTYNSNDTDPGPLGPGWRSSYSDRLVLESGGARYLASDGRQIAFSRKGSGFAIEPGAARFTLARSGDGYVLTDFDQLRMRFSAAGELQPIRDRNNQGVVVTHSGGRVASVANGRRSLTYAYNEVGLISTITLTGPGVEPRVVRYDYGGGRLTGVTSPGGVKTRYEYDGAGRLRSEFHDDSSGNLIRVFDALGHGARHTYDALGRVTSSADAGGNVTRRSYSATNDLVAVVDPLGGSRTRPMATCSASPIRRAASRSTRWTAGADRSRSPDRAVKPRP
jgi:YD repeat-containing protein